MRFKPSALKRRASEEIKRDSDLIILSIISALLAGFAIYMNNIPLLIGSMLIGPFFDPILSISVLGILDRNKKKFVEALGSLFFMITLAISAASIQFFLIRYLTDFAISDVTPIGFVESFLVALLLGAVGMLLWMWTKSSSLAAGVSIAIFLVPPLVNIAIGIVFLNFTFIIHYSLLFFINCIGMIIGSFLVLKFFIDKNGG